MSQIFFDEMHIPKPDYNLGINSLGHGAMTGRMIEEIEKILIKECPDFVLIFGDTNSTLAGSLAASKLHIKIVHVEAGLRSFNMKMPEEVNRILADRISDILLCPTSIAVDNLTAEGFPNKMEGQTFQKIINVGDVMYDSAIFYSKFSYAPQIELNLEKPFALATVHRQENVDDTDILNSIFQAFGIISHEIPIVIPVHPRVGNILKGMKIRHENIHLINPVSYLEMVYLLKHCNIVLTDSGGLQKEAFFFEKPCITLREQTEWIELVDMNVNFIVGTSIKKIIETYNTTKTYNFTFKQRPYGAGDSADKIINIILEYN